MDNATNSIQTNKQTETLDKPIPAYNAAEAVPFLSGWTKLIPSACARFVKSSIWFDGLAEHDLNDYREDCLGHRYPDFHMDDFYSYGAEDENGNEEFRTDLYEMHKAIGADDLIEALNLKCSVLCAQLRADLIPIRQLMSGEEIYRLAYGFGDKERCSLTYQWSAALSFYEGGPPGYDWMKELALLKQKKHFIMSM